MVLPFPALAALLGLLLGGCATPGPLHLYTISPAPAMAATRDTAASPSTPAAEPATIRDLGPEDTKEFPTFLKDGETLVSFTYDPFTDFFFIRLAPGNTFRVVSRPRREVMRELTVKEIPSDGSGGDLAVRPVTGHIYVLLEKENAVVEINRFGGFERRIVLAPAPAGAGAGAADLALSGLAYDTAQNRLLVLAALAPGRVAFYTREGEPLSSVALDRNVEPGGLAYDPDKSEIYARLPGGHEIGIFGEDGKLRRSVTSDATLFDVAPRALVRVF